MQSLMRVFSQEALNMAEYFPRIFQWKSMKNDTDTFTTTADEAYRIKDAMKVEEKNTNEAVSNEAPFFP